jgi:uncharacterized sporulation protein YeaH/YhbH (DUF444 family)
VTTGQGEGRPRGAGAWYDLFSRGARDWLRHNEKVRDAVRSHLPEVVAGGDVLSRGGSTVRVPVRMLEHYRFRLRTPQEVSGIGQGAAKPGDRVTVQNDQTAQGGRGGGGDDDGGIQYELEFQVDDIVDWLWEEMQLPNLVNRTGGVRDDEWTREGWDRRGARSRLDRRRSLKESVKRQAVQREAPAFTNDDLRFRQLSRREQPATRAVVFLVLDVSASMSESSRKLAKTFFFWAVQGLRRRYRYLEIVFVAHTTSAWEFSEEEFFKVSGSGGTFMSAAVEKVKEIIAARFAPTQHNLYVFYASDGENSPGDNDAAQAGLESLLDDLQYAGFLEVGSPDGPGPSSDIGQLFRRLESDGRAVAAFRAGGPEDVWAAVRHFFSREQSTAAGFTP